MKNIFKAIFFISLFLIFIFSILSASQISNLAKLSFFSNKLIHFLIYFYLTYIGLISYFHINRLFLIFLIFIYGFCIEIIHFYHPNRLFEIFDLLSNLLGIVAGSLLFNLKFFFEKY